MRTLFVFAAAVLTLGIPGSASAHAFLDHAVPGVGSTVSGAPANLELDFTQDIVGALSNVRVTAPNGTAVAASKPVVTGTTLRVHLGRALAAGTYVVHWHVVSVDTHPTSGSFKFTVSP